MISDPPDTFWPSPDYIPLDYVHSNKAIYIHCIHGPAHQPKDAFIRSTERRQQDKHESRILLPLSTLSQSTDRNQVPLTSSHTELAGMLFHSGRCGSTLLCNMLDTLPDCFVVRESNIINRLLSDKTLGNSEKERFLRTVLTLYCRYAHFLDKRCVIKLSSHATLHLAFLMQCLPKTPWIYLYRNPEDVIRSFSNKPPRWLSKPFLIRHLPILEDKVPNTAPDQIALMLHCAFQNVMYQFSLCNNISKIKKPGLLSYEQLIANPIDIVKHITNRFSLSVSTEHHNAISTCLQVDAKTGKKRTKAPAQDILKTVLPNEYASHVTSLWKFYELFCQNTG